MKVLAATLLIATTALAGPTEHTVLRAPDAPIPEAGAAEMAWLAGRWSGDGLGGRTEEIWQLKHFHPDMKGWEEKDKYVEFLYVGRDGERYRFEGLTFDRTGEDAVTVYLALRQKDGSVSEAKFQMTRHR